MPWKVPRIWDGGECWILGGGHSMPRQFGVPADLIKAVCDHRAHPSDYSRFMAPIHDRHIIGINNSYFIGNWIDVLFFGDNTWFRVHERNIAVLGCIKVSCAPRMNGSTGKINHVKYVAKNKAHREGISSDNGFVSWNRNSGAAAISLAYQFGVKRIFLLGFDMNNDEGESHWHGGHSARQKIRRKNAPPYRIHLKGFPAIASDAKKFGLEILNVNPDSAITVFRKINLQKALEISNADRSFNNSDSILQCTNDAGQTN